MYKKMSEARRRAFLRALEETGNQTLAAERARVSRSWACQRRMSDPGFDAACRAAIEAARRRFGPAERCAPPRGWGFLDGEELVVRGTGGGGGGKRVQVARARLDQWTPRVEDGFLAVLQATCNVKAALSAVGKSKGSAYTHRKRWPGFARRWREAEEAGMLRLDWALVEHAQNLTSRSELPPPAPMPPLGVEEILHSLYMHGHLRGMGRPPGRLPKAPSFEAVCASILYKIEAIERAEALSEADKAALRAEWRGRRPS
jgi:hypothetical protein